MEHSYRSKSSRYTAILLSCILHGALILLIAWHGMKNQNKHTRSSKKTDELNYVAHALISTGMHEPASILFQDEPPSGKDVITAQDPQSMASGEPINQAGEKISKLNQDEEEHSTQAATTAHPALTEQADSCSPSASSRDRADTIEKTARTISRRTVTMAEISRGFLRSVQQEAGYNKPSRDTQQLTLQIYATKIWNIIKNAFLSGENGIHMSENIHVQAHLIVTIDRSGALQKIYLDCPKDIPSLRQIERLIVSRANRAGLFPPLPISIPGTSKTFSFPLLIEGQKGFHAYALGYR